MPDLTVSRKGPVVRLCLDRPKVRNALSPALLEALIEACGAVADDDTCSVVVVSGASGNFSAGADLPQFMAAIGRDAHGTADLGRRAAEALKALPQVSIAAIDGYCIGGGIVLAAACDLRIAADDASFSIPELDAGIPLSWGGMADLVRLVGETRALELVLTCRPFTAAEARECGFLSRVAPADSFADSLASLVDTVAEKPRIVLLQTKDKMRRIRAGSFDARQDAAAMLDALADEEARQVSRNYIRTRIGRSGGE